MEREEAFWSRVQMPEGDACWEWTAARLRRPNGSLSYGQVQWGGRVQYAHRVAWTLLNGPIPEDRWVLHRCDNQGCVRPDHLYLGDHADNTRDAVVRRRMFSGEQMWNHKLREIDVRAIRVLLEAGYATEKIGAFFGVSGRTIRYVRSDKRWKDVA